MIKGWENDYVDDVSSIDMARAIAESKKTAEALKSGKYAKQQPETKSHTLSPHDPVAPKTYKEMGDRYPYLMMYNRDPVCGHLKLRGRFQCNMCGEITLFRSLTRRNPKGNRCIYDIPMNTMQLATALDDGVAVNAILRSLDEHFPIIVERQHKSKYTILVSENNISAPSKYQFQNFIKRMQVSGIPTCLSVELDIYGDGSSHVAVLVIYPDGDAYLVDPSGISESKRVSNNNVEMFVENAIRGTGAHLIRQRTWLGEFRPSLVDFEETLPGHDIKNGHCVVRTLILASMIVDHKSGIIGAFKHIEGIIENSPDMFMNFIARVYHILYPYFEHNYGGK